LEIPLENVAQKYGLQSRSMVLPLLASTMGLHIPQQEVKSNSIFPHTPTHTTKREGFRIFDVPAPMAVVATVE